MDDEITVNLTASLGSTATELSGVANGLAGLSTGDEIEQQATILDRIAEDASEGAAILRALIVRRKHAHGLLPTAGALQCRQRGPGPPRPRWRGIVIEHPAVVENLELLRREWGHAYVIWFQASQYCTCRRDNAAICRRVKAEDLRTEMDTDYRACPVLV
jgi:hypothetical protein